MGKKKKWWSFLAEGTAPNVIFLQFDLGSHTQTAREMETDPQAFQEFKSFGLRLEDALKSHGFDCLHWLGDGGLFAKEYRKIGDADNVCVAADEAFSIFETMWGQSTYRLTLRVTATLLDRVYISQQAGYWYSLGLNHFLKHERRIGRPGAFVITSDLKRSLSHGSDVLARFKGTEPQAISIEGGVSFLSWTDTGRPARVQPAPDRFEVWLARNTRPQPSRQIQEGYEGYAVGDSLVLGSALTKGGYESVSLVPVSPLPGTGDFVKEFREEYENRLRDLAPLTGKKASVTKYLPPLTDDPMLRLEWQLLDYPQARAFHELVESNMAAWRHYRAASLATDPRPVPNILVTHNLMILGREQAVPHLVLAHRKKGTRPGGYYNNRWSVSFEEQFSAVQSVRYDRLFPADADVQSTVFRGAREEFLGEHFDGACTVRLHAVQIEALNFNLGVLGAVTLPEMTFEDLTNRWCDPDAIDRHEHDAILAIPCERGPLRSCLESEGLPADLRDTRLKYGRSDLAPEDHLWHPTSKARLAMCLWLVESGAI
jgi:hypothetical protein